MREIGTPPPPCSSRGGKFSPVPVRFGAIPAELRHHRGFCHPEWRRWAARKNKRNWIKSKKKTIEIEGDRGRLSGMPKEDVLKGGGVEELEDEILDPVVRKGALKSSRSEARLPPQTEQAEPLLLAGEATTKGSRLPARQRRSRSRAPMRPRRRAPARRWATRSRRRAPVGTCGDRDGSETRTGIEEKKNELVPV
jgi:hypothetical protein